MSSNLTLLQKADMALADLSGAGKGGLLQPEQAATFLRKVIEQPTIINRARTVGMGAPTRKINKIGFGSRILRAATSATALTQAQRSKPATEQIEMTAKEFVAEVWLPYDVLEDNIERAEAANNEGSNTGPGGLRTTLITLIAQRAALDLEEIGLLSDTTSLDADLATQDGWLKLAKNNGNDVDVASAAISKSMFKSAKLAMPDKYLRGTSQMQHYVAHDQETEYRDILADRATALGDRMVEGSTKLMAFGSEIVPVALMPQARGLFCNPLNLIFGMYRDISLEYDKDISARVYKIVLSTRVAFQIEEAEAVVHYDNIG